LILQIGQTELYRDKIDALSLRLVESTSVPRGRIFDRNYNLLVDNIGYKTIYYQKPKGIKKGEEIELAYQVANVLEVPYNKLHITNLKEFWLLRYPKEAKHKITDGEYEQLKMRKLTQSDIQKLKINRVTADDLDLFNENDKCAAYIYYLMNKGYYFDEKIIKDKDVTDEEYAYISENTHIYKGFNTKLEWERNYVYGDTLREILGTVSTTTQGIPYELKNHYLNKDYALNDRVGLSYLEFQYEELLKGKKNLYKVNRDNSFELVGPGIRGYDIVLSIDINLQLEVEQIMIEEMIKAKKTPNTDFYNKSFIVISNPFTGEILAYAAKQVVEGSEGIKVYDYTPYIATTPIVSGSVVKGASMAVGYNSGAINIGTKMLDECIKIRHTPPKCSWTKGLGVLDDIGALRLSSNSYQYKIAIKVGKGNYSYDKPLTIDLKAFDVYRNTFNQFGLGIKTEIDLPTESVGYKGKSEVAGHLLDFAMGQYDTYTPIQLTQYVNTIANGGNRLKLNLLKQVHEPTTEEAIGKMLYQVEPTVLNIVDIEKKYLERIQLGFKEVMIGMLGRGYMGELINTAGKTGTSQSFFDSTGDGKIDKDTISKAFVGYYPADNPIMSIVAISPDVSHRYNNSTFTSNVNKQITARVCNKFFELFQ
jgi:penicillin-binding protein A